MDVVEQRAPGWVVVEDRVGEADQATLALGKDRAGSGPASPEPLGPHREPIGDDVAIEERGGVGAAIVTAPAIGMQRRDGASIGWPRERKSGLADTAREY